MIIYSDIDNTICKTKGTDYENAEPVYENIAQINALFDEGHTIIYWTSRGALLQTDFRYLTEKQLLRWGCKYRELRMDKPYFDRFYDDRAEKL